MDVPTLASAAGSAQPPVPPAASVPALGAPHSAEADLHVLGEHDAKQAGISPAIAKIFGGEGDSKAAPLSVSYTIVNHQIHTVFTDPDTGEEIAQFPPDLLAHVAAFFDQVSGVTLDQNA